MRFWEGGHDNGDVRFAIDQFAKQIANADTKAGLLGAALAVLSGALGQEAGLLARHLPPRSVVDWAFLIGLAVSLASATTSVAFVVRAVAPTIRSSDQFSRYSWSVADTTVANLVQADARQDRREGWLTAALLASIARRKFGNLRRAFRWWVAGTLVSLLVALAGLGH